VRYLDLNIYPIGKKVNMIRINEGDIWSPLLFLPVFPNLRQEIVMVLDIFGPDYLPYRQEKQM
jgi:hypothetical protein